MTTATMTPQVAAAVAKVQAIRTELRTRFIERDDAILGLLVAAIGRQHMVMLGSAGEAKSAVADAFRARITGARGFKTLLGRDSKVEQVMGPLMLTALKQDRYARRLDGRIGDVEIAFLDEIFKANSTLLNDLLGVLNEREVENDGKLHACPLEFCIGASNEMPDSNATDSLAALWDRLIVRLNVTTLSDAGHQQFMYDEQTRRQARARGAETSGKTGATLSLGELHLLQNAALQVTIPQDVMKTWFDIRDALAAKGHARPSTRASGWLQDLICAHALLHGRMTATQDDLAVLAFALWNTPAEARDVKAIVLSVASPLVGKAQELHDKAVAVAEDFLVKIRKSGITPVEANTALIETRQAIIRFGTDMKTLRDAAAGQGRDTTLIDEMLGNVRAKRDTVLRAADQIAGAIVNQEF